MIVKIIHHLEVYITFEKWVNSPLFLLNVDAWLEMAV
jgi:hypothetical protein